MPSVGKLVATAAAATVVVAAGADEQVCRSAPQAPAWHSYFPPEGSDAAEFFRHNVPVIPGPPPNVTAAEREYATWSAAEFIARRRAGDVTCEEFARALTKRAVHYKDMNQVGTRVHCACRAQLLNVWSTGKAMLWYYSWRDCSARSWHCPGWLCMVVVTNAVSPPMMPVPYAG